MAEPGIRDVAALKVERAGRVAETGDPLRPFVLLDEHGAEVAAVSEFLHHMLADDARLTSLRSYAYELLGWFRPVNCTVSLISSRADRLAFSRSMVWSMMYDVPSWRGSARCPWSARSSMRSLRISRMWWPT